MKLFQSKSDCIKSVYKKKKIMLLFPKPRANPLSAAGFLVDTVGPYLGNGKQERFSRDGSKRGGV